MNASDFAELLRTFSIWLASNGMALAFAAIPATIAARRGWPAWLGFVAGIVLHWVPAIILFSILPPRKQLMAGRQGTGRGLEKLEKERSRMEETERRAAAPPTATRPAAKVRGSAQASAADPAAKARRPASVDEALARPAPLPPPPIQDLPLELHGDPLADAPRATLAGAGDKSRGHSGRPGAATDPAGSAGSAEDVGDSRDAGRDSAANEAPDRYEASAADAPPAPSKPAPPRSLSAGGEG